MTMKMISQSSFMVVYYTVNSMGAFLSAFISFYKVFKLTEARKVLRTSLARSPESYSERPQVVRSTLKLNTAISADSAAASELCWPKWRAALCAKSQNSKRRGPTVHN